MKRPLKTFEYTKDYGLAGKKKGDKIKLFKLPTHLKSYLKEVDGGEKEEKPTDEWTKGDIAGWLAEHGHEDAKGTKEELLKLVAKTK